MSEKIITVFFTLPQEISSSISNVKEKFSLGFSNVSIIHITFHLARIPEENFDQIIEDLQILDLQRFKVRLLEPTQDQKDFFSIPVEKSQALQGNHQKIVETINIHRESLIREKDAKRATEGALSEFNQNMLNKYGYTRVFENFSPHITLGYPNEGVEPPKEIIKQIKNDLKSLSTRTFPITDYTVRLNNYNNHLDRYSTLEENTIELH